MLFRPKRVLWPTDFSELSYHGGRYARAFCETFEAELRVVHVLSPPSAFEVTTSLLEETPPAAQTERMTAMAREGLNRLVGQLFGGLKNVSTDAFFATPWTGVCDYAAQNHVDLIIVATHGRSGLRRVLVGGTAERIVQHAPCPVLVVKHPEQEFVTEE